MEVLVDKDDGRAFVWTEVSTANDGVDVARAVPKKELLVSLKKCVSSPVHDSVIHGSPHHY